MRFTIEDVARAAIGRVATTATQLQACDWASQVFRQLCSRARFKHLARRGEVIVPGEYTTGTLTVTRGSTIVTGVATAWSQLFNGRYIKISNIWYEIEDVPSATELRLVSPFAEDSVSASGYRIVARYVELPSDVRWIDQNMMHPRSMGIVRHIPQTILNARDPRRQLGNSAGPTYWSEAGVSKANKKLIEFYPYPTSDELVAFLYWIDAPVLGITDEVPGFTSFECMVEGTLIHVMKWNMSAAGDQGEKEMWRNESQAQMTRWERLALTEIKNDRGPEGVTVVREFLAPGQLSSMDDRTPTAEDHVVLGWG